MNTNNFKIKVNGKFDFDLDLEELNSSNLIELGNGCLHLIKNGESVHAEILSLDQVNKEITVKIGQDEYLVNISDSHDQLIEKLGLNKIAAQKINDIKAPMPGLVLGIEVEIGSEVVQGDPLLVLEAMKMENVIKSPGNGQVKSIFTQKGKAVEKGELLIELA